MKTIVIHQVNCQGVMGAGFAKYVKNKFPELYNEYRLICKQKNPYNLLGDIYVYNDENYIIINIFSQLYYGNKSNIVYTNYKAMESSLIKVRRIFPTEDIIAPKYIGCGFGGGDWNIVRNILEKYNILVSENIIFEK